MSREDEDEEGYACRWTLSKCLNWDQEISYTCRRHNDPIENEFVTNRDCEAKDSLHYKVTIPFRKIKVRGVSPISAGMRW